jgi:hypothetical protein
MAVPQIQNRSHWPTALLAVLLVAGCAAATQSRCATCPFSSRTLPITATAQPLAAPGQPCEDKFAYHALDHTTVPPISITMAFWISMP